MSAIIGLLPLEPIDFNAFSNYFSRYNSLRIAKGFLWALTLIPLLIKEAKRPEVIQREFHFRYLDGISGVVMVALWERQDFLRPLEFLQRLRIT